MNQEGTNQQTVRWVPHQQGGTHHMGGDAGAVEWAMENYVRAYARALRVMCGARGVGGWWLSPPLGKGTKI